MGQYDTGATENRFLRRISQLEARIRALETAAPLRNASISDGGVLIVKDRDGETLIRMGRSDDPALNAPDGNPQMLFQLYRSTGEVAFEVIDPLPAVDGFQQFVAIRDRAGNAIVSDDTTSGQGLSRPFIGIPFGEYIQAPTSTTTSGSFVTMQRATIYKQHPKLIVKLLAQASAAGTTGEVRLWNSTAGEQVGSTLSVGSGAYIEAFIGGADGVVNGAHEDLLDIDVQARRTAGAGTIGTRVLTAWGYPSG